MYSYRASYLGSPVVPFCPFHMGVSLLKPNTRKKGTLSIKGLLRNLVIVYFQKFLEGLELT